MQVQTSSLPSQATPDSQPRRFKSGRRGRNIAIAIAICTVLGGGGFGLDVLNSSRFFAAAENQSTSHSGPAPKKTTHGERQASVPAVKVVRPKKDEGAEIVFERIATVEPLYRADLRARASGLVKAIHFEIGDLVHRGDVLVDIDVAEWEQEVVQKAAVVTQREKELLVSEAKKRDAMAGRGVTAATIKQREADVTSAKAARDLKKQRLVRYKDLANRKSVTGSVVEEEERDLATSEAAVLSASAGVDRAKADHEESASKLEAAEADVELKKSQIEVARADVERARIVADFGKVKAPFDGVVIRRNVDPGSFVQNATTGSSETLISVARIDLLTVVGQFPDNLAPYVTNDTSAVVSFSDISGVPVSTNISRFSPNVQSADRTIRVEIDLYNGDAQEQKACEKQLRSEADPSLRLSPRQVMPAPVFSDEHRKVRRILPGMNASVKLAIAGSRGAFAVPSTAVYSRGGTKYILVVEQNRTKQIPVQVHMNDGRRTRLSLSTRQSTVGGPDFDNLSELTGEELIVANSQLQVGNDVDVRPVETDW